MEIAFEHKTGSELASVFKTLQIKLASLASNGIEFSADVALGIDFSRVSLIFRLCYSSNAQVGM